MRALSTSRAVQEIYNGEIEESQLSNCVTIWNAHTNPASTVTELLSITFKNEILKACIFYQHKIIQQNVL